MVRHRYEASRLGTTLRVLFLSAILILIWFLGLVWFTTLLPKEVTDRTSDTDAIVVLTGGSDRLEEGLRLLKAERAEKLFVSGVYRGVEVRHLLDVLRQSRAGLECCIALGYEADNTSGNAAETAAWLKQEGYNSLRLVTAAYHMPRSLLEFRQVMPDIEIIPHPVFPKNFHQDDWWRWPGSASLLMSEYNKYLIAVTFGALRDAVG